MNAPLLNAATDPLRAIMRSFEFSVVATSAPAPRTDVSPLARRARPSANPKSRIKNRKF